MASIVYWIHLEDHTDIFSQGYIGVSKDHKKRWHMDNCRLKGIDNGTD